MGTAIITVSVSDNGLTTNRSFEIHVTAPAAPPTISGLTDQTTTENSPTAVIPFTIGDSDFPSSSLIVTAVSDNSNLVPSSVANIILGGSGSNRTIQLSPLANQTGTTDITVMVREGTTTTSYPLLQVDCQSVNADHYSPCRPDYSRRFGNDCDPPYHQRCRGQTKYPARDGLVKQYDADTGRNIEHKHHARRQRIWAYTDAHAGRQSIRHFDDHRDGE